MKLKIAALATALVASSVPAHAFKQGDAATDALDYGGNRAQQQHNEKSQQNTFEQFDKYKGSSAGGNTHKDNNGSAK